MALSRKEKEQLAKDLAEKLKASAGATVFSFQALTVADSSALRRELRKSGGKLRVVKKRVFRHVARHLGMPETASVMEGSVALAWSGDDIAAAKAVHTFLKGTKNARMEAGLLGGAYLPREEVERLALLPGQTELRGQLVSVLAGPIRGLAGVFAATLRGLPGVLHAHAEKHGAGTASSLFIS